VNIVTLACHCDVQQALDKMASEWTPINFEVMSYKSTGTYIIKIGEEVSQLLDDHIVMTQSMSFSPYKQPFEERISKWESQLRITQVCVCVCVFTTSHVSYLVSSFFYHATRASTVCAVVRVRLFVRLSQAGIVLKHVELIFLAQRLAYAELKANLIYL